MTEFNLDQFIDECYEELTNKQNELFKEYDIGSYESYWFDQEAGKIQFINGSNVELEFEFTCIGTWASRTNTWMWPWANQSFIETVRDKSLVFRELSAVTGVDQFVSEGYNCDEAMAYEITAVCVHHIKAMGMYKVPGDRSDMFLALVKSL